MALYNGNHLLMWMNVSRILAYELWSGRRITEIKGNNTRYGCMCLIRCVVSCFYSVNSPFYILLFVLHFWTDLYFFLTFSYEFNYLLDLSMYFIYFVYNFRFLIHGDFHILKCLFALSQFCLEYWSNHFYLLWGDCFGLRKYFLFDIYFLIFLDFILKFFMFWGTVLCS